MKKYYIIFNPNAGRKSRRDKVDLLVSEIIQRGHYAEVVESQRQGHAYDLAKRGSEDFDYIVAAGGDGTINEIVSGIMDSNNPNIPVGILPIGSGNDSYKMISTTYSLDRAIEYILKEKVKSVDIGLSDRGQYVLNIASLGLDSMTAEKAEGLKKYMPGSVAYLLALIISMVKFRKIKIKIDLDNEVIESNTMLLSFGKGRYYGGGIGIMPWAVNDDGYFHLVNVVDIKNIFLFVLAPSIAFGKHTSLKKYVKVYKSKTVKVKSADKFNLNIDGEIYKGLNHMSFEIKEKALNMLVK